MSLLGWLFLIASWIVPKWIYPMPGDVKKKYGLALIFCIISVVCFTIGLIAHVHGPGCNH